MADPRPFNAGPKEYWNKGQPNYDYRWGRKNKIAKVKLPEIDKQRQDHKMTPDEMRSILKERGVVPHRPWNQRPIMMLSTSEILDEYVPEEGDGKASKLTLEVSWLGMLVVL